MACDECYFYSDSAFLGGLNNVMSLAILKIDVFGFVWWGN
jgi:hypothetical protein